MIGFPSVIHEKTCFLFKKAVRRSVADQKIPERNSRVHLIHAQDNNLLFTLAARIDGPSDSGRSL